MSFWNRRFDLKNPVFIVTSTKGRYGWGGHPYTQKYKFSHRHGAIKSERSKELNRRLEWGMISGWARLWWHFNLSEDWLIWLTWRAVASILLQTRPFHMCLFKLGLNVYRPYAETNVLILLILLKKWHWYYCIHECRDCSVDLLL